jgi:hypothetical protein
MWEFYCRVSSTQIQLTYCGRGQPVSVPSFLVFLAMNIKSFSCALLYYVAFTRAHGDHSHEPDSGDAAQYAQRHVRVHLMHLCPF